MKVTPPLHQAQEHLSKHPLTIPNKILCGAPYQWAAEYSIAISIITVLYKIIK